MAEKTPWQIIKEGLENKRLQPIRESGPPTGYSINFDTPESAAAFRKALMQVGLESVTMPAEGAADLTVRVNSTDPKVNAAGAFSAVIDLVSELTPEGIPQKTQTLPNNTLRRQRIDGTANGVTDFTPTEQYQDPVALVKKSLVSRSAMQLENAYSTARDIMSNKLRSETVDLANYERLVALGDSVSNYERGMRDNTKRVLEALKQSNASNIEQVARVLAKPDNLNAWGRRVLQQIEDKAYRYAYEDLLSNPAKRDLMSPDEFNEYKKLLDTANDGSSKETDRTEAQNKLEEMRAANPKLDVKFVATRELRQALAQGDISAPATIAVLIPDDKLNLRGSELREKAIAAKSIVASVTLDTVTTSQRPPTGTQLPGTAPRPAAPTQAPGTVARPSTPVQPPAPASGPVTPVQAPGTVARPVNPAAGSAGLPVTPEYIPADPARTNTSVPNVSADPARTNTSVPSVSADPARTNAGAPNVPAGPVRTASSTPAATRISEIFNGPNAIGTYFDFTNVRNVAANIELPALLQQSVGNQKAELLDAAAKLLNEKYGIRRLSYFAEGTSSMVFSSVPDSNGRMQLVTLTPAEQAYINHPAMLPDKASHTIEVNGRKMVVRISPQLIADPTGLGSSQITRADSERMETMLRSSGLDAWDFRILPENHPNYHREVHRYGGNPFKTSNILLHITEKGEKVFYVADRDSVVWPAGTTEEQKKAKIEQWATDPAFENYRRLTPKLMTNNKVEGTFKELQPYIDALPEGDPLREALKRGLYPVEVMENAATEATRASFDPNVKPQDSGKVWLETFKASVLSYDTSRTPTGAPTALSAGLAKDQNPPAVSPDDLRTRVGAAAQPDAAGMVKSPPLSVPEPEIKTAPRPSEPAAEMKTAPRSTIPEAEVKSAPAPDAADPLRTAPRPVAPPSTPTPPGNNRNMGSNPGLFTPPGDNAGQTNFRQSNDQPSLTPPRVYSDIGTPPPEAGELLARYNEGKGVTFKDGLFFDQATKKSYFVTELGAVFDTTKGIPKAIQGRYEMVRTATSPPSTVNMTTQGAVGAVFGWRGIEAAKAQRASDVDMAKAWTMFVAGNVQMLGSTTTFNPTKVVMDKAGMLKSAPVESTLRSRAGSALRGLGHVATPLMLDAAYTKIMHADKKTNPYEKYGDYISGGAMTWMAAAGTTEATLGARAAARMGAKRIPVVGWALVAYDGVEQVREQGKALDSLREQAEAQGKSESVQQWSRGGIRPFVLKERARFSAMNSPLDKPPPSMNDFELLSRLEDTYKSFAGLDPKDSEVAKFKSANPGKFVPREAIEQDMKRVREAALRKRDDAKKAMLAIPQPLWAKLSSGDLALVEGDKQQKADTRAEREDLIARFESIPDLQAKIGGDDYKKTIADLKMYNDQINQAEDVLIRVNRMGYELAPSNENTKGMIAGPLLRYTMESGQTYTQQVSQYQYEMAAYQTMATRDGPKLARELELMERSGVMRRANAFRTDYEQKLQPRLRAITEAKMKLAERSARLAPQDKQAGALSPQEMRDAMKIDETPKDTNPLSDEFKEWKARYDAFQSYESDYNKLVEMTEEFARDSGIGPDSLPSDVKLTGDERFAMVQKVVQVYEQYDKSLEALAEREKKTPATDLERFDLQKNVFRP